MEHKGKVVETDERFEHVMAIALDSRTGYHDGVLRCITSRSGDVKVKGNLDRSVLHKVHGDTLEHYAIGEKVVIKNQEEIISQLSGPGWNFIGLEDPDIWIDEKANMMHLYFTIPLKHKLTGPEHERMRIYLGHAVGKDLDSLVMTMPVLLGADHNQSAKEVSIAPINKQELRYNLFESADRVDKIDYSTVRVAKVLDMGKSWEFGETVFHPAEHKIPWIGGHASPGPLLPREFIDVGEGKLLGFMNGREANTKVGDETHYGTFSVGLFIYDYEHGKIDWVSPESFIKDSEAETITFASQFVPIATQEGILYAHVDDSFVRAYSITADLLKKYIPIS